MKSQAFPRISKINAPDSAVAPHGTHARPWKILIVDNEEDVHAVTRLTLADCEFDGRAVEFLSAYSGAEAVRLFSQHRDVAVALIDVVMESDDSGLNVVRYVRQRLYNRLVRMILRTGQPGIAPEREIITDYDINDYMSKAELSSDGLFSAVVASLRAYRDLIELDAARHAAHRHLEAATALFRARDIPTLAGIATNKVLAILDLEHDAHVYKSAGACWLEVDSSKMPRKVLSGIGSLSNVSLQQLHAKAGARSDPHWRCVDVLTDWHKRFRLGIDFGRWPLAGDLAALELFQLQLSLVANSILGCRAHVNRAQQALLALLTEHGAVHSARFARAQRIARHVSTIVEQLKKTSGAADSARCRLDALVPSSLLCELLPELTTRVEPERVIGATVSTLFRLALTMRRHVGVPCSRERPRQDRAVPLAARVYAVAAAAADLSEVEMQSALAARAGTDLDPDLVDLLLSA